MSGVKTQLKCNIIKNTIWLSMSVLWSKYEFNLVNQYLHKSLKIMGRQYHLLLKKGNAYTSLKT
jgi:hypothetical protein